MVFKYLSSETNHVENSGKPSDDVADREWWQNIKVDPALTVRREFVN